MYPYISTVRNLTAQRIATYAKNHSRQTTRKYAIIAVWQVDTEFLLIQIAI